MLAAALVVGAFVVLVVGQHGVAGTPLESEAIAFVVSSGFAALVLVLLAVGLLLGADSNDEMRKLRRIERALRKEALPGAWEVLAQVQGEGAAAERSSRLAHQREVGAITVAFVLGGCALIGWGWLRAARTVDVSQAFDGLVLGFLGVAVVAGAVAAQDVRRQAGVDRSRSELFGGMLDQRGGDSPAQALLEDGDVDDAKWTGAGLARFHRATCPALVTTTTPDERYEVNGSDLDACELCHPERA